VREAIASVTDSADKVDRIRDLLFGTHMRDDTQRFDAISRDSRLPYAGNSSH
jgi:hypothetical protein